MKKNLSVLLLGIVCVTFTSCLKSNDSCTPNSVQSEEAAIVAYATTNGINATRHSSGLYYEIIAPGSGPTASINSYVFVRYTGKLLNGTIFDQRTDHTTTGWLLGELIAGWKIGLPLIQEGGRIKLIIPSSMGYGCETVGAVPPNSILYFDIELVDVQ